MSPALHPGLPAVSARRLFFPNQTWAAVRQGISTVSQAKERRCVI